MQSNLSRELNFRSVYQNSLVGVCLTGLDGRLLTVNPAFCQMLGYSQDEMIESFQEFFRPDDLSVGAEAIRAMLDGIRANAVIQKRYLHKNGATIWAELNITLVLDDDGKPLHFVTIIQDITEQIRASALLDQRVKELSCLSEFNRSLTALMEPAEILRAVYQYAGILMDITYFNIALYDQSEDLVSFPLAYNNNILIDVAPRKLSTGLIDYIFRTGEPLLISDHVVEYMRERGIKPIISDDNEPAQSWLGVPITYSGQVLGVISVQSITNPGQYRERDCDLLLSISRQAANAIAIAYQYDEISRLLVSVKESQERIQIALAETQQSQALLRTIIDATPDWIYIKDREHRYILVNQGYASAMHLPVEAFIGKDDLELGFPEESVMGNPQRGIRGFWADDFLVMTSGESVVVPSEQFVVDGETRFLNTIKIPLRDTKEQVWGILGFARDITDRERLLLHSQRLQNETNEQLRELTNLQRLLSRQAWSTWEGSTVSDIRGYLFDQDSLKSLDADLIGELRSGRDATHRQASSRTERPNSYSTSLIVRGEPIGSLGIKTEDSQFLTDEDEAFLQAISGQVAQALERARLLEQTHKSAIELQAVADVSTAASTILNPKELLQTVVDLTKKNFDLYNVQVYLLDDKKQNLILAVGAGGIGQELISQEWQIPVEEEYALVARVARSRQGIIYRNVKHEENYLSYPLLPDTHSELAVPMIIGDNLLGVLDFYADRANRFTEEDERTFSTLAAQVAVALQNARLYADQLATVERLRELDNMKSAFLANMSHELRTPLNSILGFTQVIMEGLDGPLSEQMVADMQLIERNGSHLLNLINNVLDMAKIEAGRVSLSTEPLSLFELLEDIVMSSSPLARNRNLTIRLDADRSVDWTVFGDYIRLRQIFVNLLGNAIKFTDEGGITVEMERMLAASQDEEERIQVRIIDTGIGIPADKLEEIFEAFIQVDTSTTRKASGTGLGLPISRKLVELHGGRLWAISSGIPGQGSTFYLELPVARVSI